MKKVTYVLIAMLMASTVYAASPTADFLKNVLAKSAAVTPGRWNSDFAKCKTYCENNGVPFVAVWSNGDACGHCTAFEYATNQSSFKNWMKTTGIVFWFGCPSNGYPIDEAGKGPAYLWTCAERGYRTSYTSGGPQQGFPFVRIYWPKGKIDISTDGDTVRGGLKSSAKTGAVKAASYIETKLKMGKSGGWTPPSATPPYLGGSFDPTLDNVEGARMEIETGLTTNVTIHLVRTNSNSIAYTATNFLHAVSGSTMSANKKLVWDVGVNELDAEVPVSASGTADLGLQLLDGDNKTVKDTLTVKRVAKQANSPENPLFVGKESASLKFGEWSMDLDAVTNLVAKTNGGGQLSSGKPLLGMVPTTAYAMVLFGGAMWCPDCAKSDEYFFKTDTFKTWATNNKIALGVVDIPNLPNQTNSPCLLTTISAATGAGRVHGYDKMSGLGYLTRHMISSEAARAVYDRNVSLATNNVLNGGWNRPLPERANQNRPGVPILLLLRGDGSIAGRFTAMASVSPTNTANNAAYIRRLNELLAQVDDAEEESNDGVKTTAAVIGFREEVTSSISCNDERDIYRIVDAAGLRLQIKFQSPDAAANKNASVVCSVINSNGNVVVTASGVIGDGVTLDYKVPATGDYFIQISQGRNSSPFSATSSSSTVVEYKLTTDFVLEPTQKRDERSNVEGTVKIALESGKKYFFDGTLDAAGSPAFDDGVLTADGKKTIYTALVDGVVDVELTGSNVVFQEWDCGRIGFYVRSATVNESVKKYDIQVARTGGVSGIAEYRVRYVGAYMNGRPCEFDKEARDTLLKADWDLDEGTILAWGDGDGTNMAARVFVIDNQFADGSVEYRFVGEKTGGDADVEEEMQSFSLNVKDNDRRNPGALEIADHTPKFTTSMALSAVENSTVTLLVRREGGADGEFSASLKASAGQFEGGVKELTHDWASRDVEPWVVTLTLPARSVAKKVSVDLAPLTSATVVKTSARRLAITVLPGSVPEFKNADAAVDAFCNVELPKDGVKVAEAKAGYTPAGALTFKKVSGSLSTGLSAVPGEAPGEILLVGTPRSKGVFTAVYRIFDDDVGGTTVSVTVAVSDPASGTVYTVNPEAPQTLMPNPAIAFGRTYHDVMVKDGGRLDGLLTVTLPANGKASAKYRSVEGAVSLSANGWSDFDSATGSATALLEGAGSAGTSYILSATVAPDGAVNLTFTVKKEGEADKVYDIPVTQEAWSVSNPATDYMGYYTVSLPGVGSINPNVQTKVVSGKSVLALGDGYMTLRMDGAALNQGQFTYAGLLPNGKAISGSAVVTALYHEDATNATHTYWGALPFLNVSDTDSFCGAVKIRPKTADATLRGGVITEGGAHTGCREGEYCGYTVIRRSIYQYEDAKPLWSHEERNFNDEDRDEVCYAVELDAFGTYYDAKENLKSVVDSSLGSDAVLSFFALGDDLVDTKYGSFAGWAEDKLGLNVATTVSKGVVTANSIALANASNPYALTFSFAPATGVVTGKFKLPMFEGAVTVNYRAIVLPGFGNSSCDCGVYDQEARSRPFISGTAWFDDDESFQYIYFKDKWKWLKARRSCPVSVGTEAGK